MEDASNRRPAGSAARAPLDLEALEAAAAGDHPTVEGARWITTQTVSHLFNESGMVDAKTGVFTWRPLSAALMDLRRALAVSGRPLPFDDIQRLVSFALPPLRHIVSSPRTHLVRDHEVMVLHRLREVDAKAMAWMSRLPGRTAKEKLGQKKRALGVRRRFTPDSTENRLARRVLDDLLAYAGQRQGQIQAYDTEDGHDASDGAGAPRAAELDGLLGLGQSDLLRSLLNDVRPEATTYPNNVLLSDRHYSKVFRTWSRLRTLEDDLQDRWQHALDLGRQVLLWSVVGALASEGRLIRDTLVRTARDGLRVRAEASGRSEAVISKYDIVFPPGRPIGRVSKVIHRDGGGSFGFLRGEGGDHFFHASHLEAGLQMDRLKEGTLVTFDPEHTEKGLVAKAVRHCPGVRAARVRMEGSELLVFAGTFSVAGDLRFETDPCLAWQLEIEPNAVLGARRGLPWSLTEAGHGSLRLSKREGLDVEGVRAFSDVIASRIRGHFAGDDGPDIHVHPDPPTDGTGCLGIDLSERRPWLATEEGAWPAQSTTHAWGIDTHDAGTVWVSGCLGSLMTVSTSSVRAQSLEAADATNGTDEMQHQRMRHLGVVYARVLERLAAEVPFEDRPAGIVVGDLIEDAAYRGLRAALYASRLAKAPLLVPRSVSLAAGWQASWPSGGEGGQDRASSSSVAEGDAVLLLDAETDHLSVTVLVAVYDAALEQQRPSSRGLIWQRRPPVLPDEGTRSLGTSSLLRDYAEDLLRTQCTSLDEEARTRAVDNLLHAGLIEPLVSGQPVYVPMDQGWHELRPAPHLWDRHVHAWWERFTLVVDEAWTADHPIVSLLGEVGRRSSGARLHVLTAGLPFAAGGRNVGRTVGEMKQTLGRLARLRPGDLDGPTRKGYYMPRAEQAARGAAELALRFGAGLPTWVEWMPDLYLEAVSGGHYCEVELMEGRSINPVLGETVTITVPQVLTLQPGHRAYRMPVIAGKHSKRPTRHEIKIQSPLFPLERALDVRLTLRLNYGLEDEYEVHVASADGQFTTGAIQARWIDAESAAAAKRTGSWVVPGLSLPPPRSPGASTVRNVVRRFESEFMQGMCEVDASTEDRLHRALNALFWKVRQWTAAVRKSMSERLAATDAYRGLVALSTGQTTFAASSGVSYRLPSDSWLRARALATLALIEGGLSPEGRALLVDSMKRGSTTFLARADAVEVVYACPDASLLEPVWSVARERLLFYRDTSLYNRTVRALAEIGLEHPDAWRELVRKDPTAPTHIVQLAEFALERLAQSIPQVMQREEDVTQAERLFASPFENACMLVLAAVQLRKEGHEYLKPGGRQNMRLGKLVRLVDGLMMRCGWRVKWDRSAALEKPDSLRGVSTLAFTTLTYLEGRPPAAAVTVSSS